MSFTFAYTPCCEAAILKSPQELCTSDQQFLQRNVRSQQQTEYRLKENRLLAEHLTVEQTSADVMFTYQ
jgi:hypothetical protein